VSCVQEERSSLLKELQALREERTQLQAELNKYRECDPQVIEDMSKYGCGVDILSFIELQHHSNHQRSLALISQGGFADLTRWNRWLPLDVQAGSVSCVSV